MCHSDDPRESRRFRNRAGNRPRAKRAARRVRGKASWSSISAVRSGGVNHGREILARRIPPALIPRGQDEPASRRLVNRVAARGHDIRYRAAQHDARGIQVAPRERFCRRTPVSDPPGGSRPSGEFRGGPWPKASFLRPGCAHIPSGAARKDVCRDARRLGPFDGALHRGEARSWRDPPSRWGSLGKIIPAWGSPSASRRQRPPEPGKAEALRPERFQSSGAAGRSVRARPKPGNGP